MSSDDETSSTVETAGPQLDRLQRLLTDCLDRLDELDTEVERLASELAAERRRREHLITTRDADGDEIGLHNVFIAGRPVGSIIDGLRNRQQTHTDRLDDLHTALEDGLADQRERHAHDMAKLRRRLTAVADEAGVTVTDADIIEGDTISHVLTHGVEAVVQSPSATDVRAQALLEHLPTWGRIADDSFGRRATTSAPAARRHIESFRDESLQSVQVRRVFETIVEWGADSPRDASMEKRERVLYLAVGLTPTE